HDHGVGGVPGHQQEAERGRHQEGARQQSLSLRDARAHCRRRQARGWRGVREATMNHHPSRRDMLKGSGALVVSFSLIPSDALAQGLAGTKPVALTEVDSFLAIDPKGLVTVYSGKVDLGTGVATAMRQI